MPEAGVTEPYNHANAHAVYKSCSARRFQTALLYDMELHDQYKELTKKLESQEREREDLVKVRVHDTVSRWCMLRSTSICSPASKRHTLKLTS